MATNKTPGWLIETCLLTFGLVSITNEDMARAWDLDGSHLLAWVEQGEVRTGTLEEYLPFRAGKPRGKFHRDNLDAALAQGLSGALTASGTMEVCRRLGIPLAVSCGIGGIGEVRGEELCQDLPALRDLPVTLVCAGPKDMLDRAATFRWLREQGVPTAGVEEAEHTGYLFRGAAVPLDGVLDPAARPLPKLIVQSLPEAERLADPAMLDQAVAEAKAAEARGQYFHPAANAALDRLSGGHSSRIQLRGLLENARLAARLSAR